jgi:hypothetical protein
LKRKKTSATVGDTTSRTPRRAAIATITRTLKDYGAVVTRRAKRKPRQLYDLVASKYAGKPVLADELMTRKPKRRNRQPERALHSNVFKMLQWLKPSCVWFPVPNGTDVGAKMGGLFKRQGKVKAGVSDFIFMWGASPFDRIVRAKGLGMMATCGAIELKAGDNGPSDDQLIFAGDCRLLGIPYRIARSVDEVVAILIEWDRLPLGTLERMRGKIAPRELFDGYSK